MIGLSWEPKLTLLSSVTKNPPSLPDSVSVYKPNAELVDGLFVPPNNPKNLNKLLRKQLKHTTGKNWQFFLLFIYIFIVSNVFVLTWIGFVYL